MINIGLNRRMVAGVRTVTDEAECLTPTLRASVPTEAFGFLGTYRIYAERSNHEHLD